MSNRTGRYTAGEIGRVRVIEDFLPPPADFVPREDDVKVSLSRRSIDFFKREARKRRVPLSAHDPRAGGHVCGETAGGRDIDKMRLAEAAGREAAANQMIYFAALIRRTEVSLDLTQ